MRGMGLTCSTRLEVWRAQGDIKSEWQAEKQSPPPVCVSQQRHGRHCIPVQELEPCVIKKVTPVDSAQRAAEPRPGSIGPWWQASKISHESKAPARQ